MTTRPCTECGATCDRADMEIGRLGVLSCATCNAFSKRARPDIQNEVLRLRERELKLEKACRLARYEIKTGNAKQAAELLRAAIDGEETTDAEG